VADFGEVQKVELNHSFYGKNYASKVDLVTGNKISFGINQSINGGSKFAIRQYQSLIKM
jgi:hypothetical protein